MLVAVVCFFSFMNTSCSTDADIASKNLSKDAEMFNGMLKVFLERIIPDHKKPKKIEVKEAGAKSKRSNLWVNFFSKKTNVTCKPSSQHPQGAGYYFVQKTYG